MAWLGVMSALLVGYELAVDLSVATQRALTAGWVIWALFAGGVRRQAAARPQPSAWVLSASYRGLAPARQLLRSRVGYLAVASAAVAVAASELAFLFERDRPDPAFDTATPRARSRPEL